MKIFSTLHFLSPKVSIEILNLSGDGFHVIAKAIINGQNISMLIDTGASKTVLDKAEIFQRFPKIRIQKRKELSTGLGTDSMESFSTTIESFQIGSLNLNNLEIALLDLSHIQNAYKLMGLEEISGVIGNDILVEYGAEINLVNKNIKFLKSRN